MKTYVFAAFVLGAGCASHANADQVIADDLIITGGGERALCVGGGCTEDMSFGNNRIVMAGVTLGLLFNDTNSGASSFASNDWRLGINDVDAFGEDYFAIEDATAGTAPFRVDAGAPSQALQIVQSGRIGIGTSMPGAEMHLVSPDTITAMRLESTGTTSQASDGSSWELYAGSDSFIISDNRALTFPFKIEEGAQNSSLVLKDDRVGMGTVFPAGKLHTVGNGVQLVYFESGDGEPVQVRFRTDSENRRFLAVDNDNNVKSQIIFLDDRINFTGETDSGANLWLSIGPDGIVSQGPTCGSPCDLTFDPQVFTVPAIDTHAKQMWRDMHLPAIGPTSPNEPINLTEKMGGVIHELEVAHIYIEELHARLEAQERQAAAQQLEMVAQAELNAQLLARLDALEGD